MQVCASINETSIFASWGGNNPLLEMKSRQLASANKKMMNTVQIHVSLTFPLMRISSPTKNMAVPSVPIGLRFGQGLFSSISMVCV